MIHKFSKTRPCRWLSKQECQRELWKQTGSLKPEEEWQSLLCRHEAGAQEELTCPMPGALPASLSRFPLGWS